MFLIIIWALNVILWGSIWIDRLFERIIVRDEAKSNGFVGTSLWLFVCICALVLSINDYEQEKVFDNLRVGQTYTNAFSYEPFTIKTITIKDKIANKEGNWILYSDSDGQTYTVKMDRNMYRFLKNK